MASATCLVVVHGAVGIVAMAAPCCRSHEGVVGFRVNEAALLVIRGRHIVEEITRLSVRS